MTTFNRVYPIDVQLLKKYMCTPESNTVHGVVQGNKNELSNRFILTKLLETTVGAGFGEWGRTDRLEHV